MILTVTSGTGYSIGAPASATGTISNDDVSTVTVDVSPASIAEDAAGVMTYTFTRDNTSAETPALTINFSTTGTASAGDFTASDTGTVSFAAGAATATVTVDPTADPTVEPGRNRDPDGHFGYRLQHRHTGQCDRDDQQ